MTWNSVSWNSVTWNSGFEDAEFQVTRDLERVTWVKVRFQETGSKLQVPATWNVSLPKNMCMSNLIV